MIVRRWRCDEPSSKLYWREVYRTYIQWVRRNNHLRDLRRGTWIIITIIIGRSSRKTCGLRWLRSSRPCILQASFSPPSFWPISSSKFGVRGEKWREPRTSALSRMSATGRQKGRSRTRVQLPHLPLVTTDYILSSATGMDRAWKWPWRWVCSFCQEWRQQPPRSRSPARTIRRKMENSEKSGELVRVSPAPKPIRRAVLSFLNPIVALAKVFLPWMLQDTEVGS